MGEYEWDVRRTPRPNRPELGGVYRPRAHAVAEFLALEHPRENLGWLLRQHAETRSKSPAQGRTPTLKPRIRSPVTPLDLQE